MAAPGPTVSAQARAIRMAAIHAAINFHRSDQTIESSLKKGSGNKNSNNSKILRIAIVVIIFITASMAIIVLVVFICICIYIYIYIFFVRQASGLDLGLQAGSLG